MAAKANGYNGTYAGKRLNRVAFPMGGIGAGMICLEGTGSFSHVSLRHKPDIFHEPLMYAALFVKGAKGAGVARVLEGPVPMWKCFGPRDSGLGSGGKSYGLPRFQEARFRTRFPFGLIELRDEGTPVRVQVTGWSPFLPGGSAETDDSSLPVAGVEYRIENTTGKGIEGVFSFHTRDFMRRDEKSGARVARITGGFVLEQPKTDGKAWEEGAFAAFTTEKRARVDCAWFRGGWFDAATMVWNNVAAGRAVAKGPHTEGNAGKGGSFYVPFQLKAKEAKTIRVLLAWYVPESDQRNGAEVEKIEKGKSADAAKEAEQKAAGAKYRAWYAGRFSGIREVAEYWRKHYSRLKEASDKFADCFYDTTLPAEVIEAVAANLSILKSPTCLRQEDGRFWGWEGCGENWGSCNGTCTHVWNYAQALPHLFPELERSIRETEFEVNQNESGHQNFRASLPIRPPGHDFHAAADGQLGGLMKVYREWRVSGDDAWMRRLWGKARKSLDYCVETWDPEHTGTLAEPHHNTYDIEFWGADGMCTSFYLGALAAAIKMGTTCGDDVGLYEELLAKGRGVMEKGLWNGEYFIQKIQWKGLRATDPTTAQSFSGSYSSEAVAILKKEGPKYQYGTGCISDGVLGDWLARVCGVGAVVDAKKIRSHLGAVYKYNFRADLSDHANPQRPTYAFGQEGGLLLCSWPKGGKPALPFVYSDEVWTGIEYQVAGHLIMMGRVKEGLQVVRTLRDRYDGRWRNPFDEYECGHWYARAMSSYGLLQALSGARYDAVEKVLYLEPRVKGDFRAFLCTATGYATVGIKKGKPFLTVRQGSIAVERLSYRPFCESDN